MAISKNYVASEFLGKETVMAHTKSYVQVANIMLRDVRGGC